MFRGLTFFDNAKKVKKSKKKNEVKLDAANGSEPLPADNVTSRISLTSVDEFCPLNNLHACSIVNRLENDLKHIQELSKMGFWKYNTVTDELQWSHQTYEIFERNPNFPLTYNTFLSYIHPDDKELVKNTFARAMQDPSECDVTHRIIIDDKIKWVRERTQMSAGQTGQHGVIIGTVQDITERKHAEDSLRRMSLFFTESEEAAAITDEKGNILEINAAFTRITGYSRSEIIGQNPRILKSGIQNDDFYKEMWRKILTDGSWSGEIWNKKKSGEIYPEHLRLYCVRDFDGNITNFIAMFSDISESKKFIDQIHHMAYHDPLTGLPNRSKMNTSISAALTTANAEHDFCVIAYLDLDRFKYINDTLGHATGDALLKEVARRINRTIRNYDVCSRFGGDEFVILFTHVKNKRESEIALERILSAINAPYIIDDNEIKITTSIGVTYYPEDNSDPDILIRHADSALYAAKQNGKNQIVVFDPHAANHTLSKTLIKEQVMDAVNTKTLEIYFQPCVDLVTRKIIGCETLLRWNKDGQIISPSDFLSAIDDDELSIVVGDYVLEDAFSKMEELNEQFSNSMVFVNINLFQRQLLDPKFEQKIANLLDKYPTVHPEQITFEILETVAIEDFEATNEIISKLSERGMSFAIDDFGTGYSSLKYFSKLKVNAIKIDKSFISLIDQDDTNHAIINSIISLSKAFNKKLIAEGIETERQNELLIELGCQFGQGYLFSKPVTFVEFQNLLYSQISDYK